MQWRGLLLHQCPKEISHSMSRFYMDTRRRVTTCICTQWFQVQNNPYHQISLRPSQIKIISKCNRIWNWLSGLKFWLLLIFYFWLTIKCFAKDSSGNIWKHIKILSGGRASHGPCVWGRWELWGRLQTQTVGGSWPPGDWPVIQAPTDAGFSPSVLEILCKY